VILDLNQHFPGHWIGCRVLQNLPPWSSYHNPLDLWIYLRSCLWMQGGHTWELNSSHCWCNHMHQQPRHSLLHYILLWMGKNGYPSWRQTFWTCYSSESPSYVKSFLATINMFVIFNHLNFPSPQLCNCWEMYPHWYNIFHLELPPEQPPEVMA
jgi:hypothetical protein